MSSPRLRREACAILEVPETAGAEEIRSAYRRLSRRYHPDRFADDAERSAAANELMAAINDAYALLSCGPTRRGVRREGRGAS